jgi:2-polyprenyl-6-methoxyphenol hydroxylase-like FAD-dependent oxidoreductase
MGTGDGRSAFERCAGLQDVFALARAIVLAGQLLNFLVRNNEIRSERSFPRYQQKCQQSGPAATNFCACFQCVAQK